MRRLAFGAAFVGVAVLGARLIMPRLHARLLAACTHMFEEMPEDFPPRRMLAGIEEIRLNTARALVLLEEREQADRGEQVRAGSSTGRSGAGRRQRERSPRLARRGYLPVRPGTGRLGRKVDERRTDHSAG
jgi:hypothetical protein